MAKLDEKAVASGLEIRQMMELAGWHMIQLLARLELGDTNKIAVVVGKGNKGGDGLSAARHLLNYGHQVDIFLLEREISPDAQHHLELLQKMSANIADYTDQSLDEYTVIIDSLIGYRLQGEITGNYAVAVNAINNSPARTIAYDLPTGVFASNGQVTTPAVKADCTLMLALAKKQLATKTWIILVKSF